MISPSDQADAGLGVSTSVEAGQEERFRGLIETGIALGTESSLEVLLRKVIETAASLTGARYGALGVIDRAGTGLEQFITVGIDAETQTTIGELPHGRGVLGVLIHDRRPVRLRELGEDPRAVGFPPGHPPMRTFLGVPILLRGSAYGNLYLTEKESGAEFSAGDEELVYLLAAQAAVAIENTRLYESSRQWSRQLESMNELSEALTSVTDLAELLELAAIRLRDLVDARTVLIERPTPDGRELVVEAAAGERAGELLGLRLARERSKAGRALARRRSERIDSLLDDPEVDHTVPRVAGATTALYVPLLVHDVAVGMIAVYDKHGVDQRFSDADMRIAEAFASRAALAIELSERISRQAVQTLVMGQERERQRLARELHDQTLQSLAVMRMTLSAARRKDQPDALLEATGHALDQIEEEVGNLRALIADLRPPVLDELGTEAALQTLVERSLLLGLTVRLEVDLAFENGRAATRHTPELEATIYRIVQEALHNAAKHAGVSEALARVSESDSEVDVLVQDEGRGFKADQAHKGFGLLGIQERVDLFGGTITVTSEPGHGTTVHALLPVRRRDT
jgi:signal transduction histidine kinase